MARTPVVKSKEFFPGVFSRHAEAYQQRLEDIMARGEARGRTRVIELAEPRPGMRIIDLACGPGNMTRRLAPLVAPGGEVVGVDLAPRMIELAREARIPNARFEVMDIERLEFADGSFDGAVCGHGLQFTSDLPRALREARRVLRPDGSLVASVPLTNRGGSVWTSLDAVVDRWLPPVPSVIDQQATRQTVADPSAFRQAALDAGFVSARVEAVDEEVHWESAAQMVRQLMSWWDCAARMDGMESKRRDAFTTEAIETVSREHPGAITTTGRNLVLIAGA